MSSRGGSAGFCDCEGERVLEGCFPLPVLADGGTIMPRDMRSRGPIKSGKGKEVFDRRLLTPLGSVPIRQARSLQGYQYHPLTSAIVAGTSSAGNLSWTIGL